MERDQREKTDELDAAREGSEVGISEVFAPPSEETATRAAILVPSDKVLEAAEELSKRANNPYISALARLCAGVAAYYRGDWREASNELQEATRIGRERCTGVTWEMNCAEQT